MSQVFGWVFLGAVQALVWLLFDTALETGAFTRFKFERREPFNHGKHKEDHIVTFEKRTLGKVTRHQAVGSGTVWRYFPSGERCGTLVELKIRDYETACLWAETMKENLP